MGVPKIKHVRASIVRGGGGDYHDVEGGHWIDDHVSTPMARYPEYRQSRRSFGITCSARSPEVALVHRCVRSPGGRHA